MSVIIPPQEWKAPTSFSPSTYCVNVLDACWLTDWSVQKSNRILTKKLQRLIMLLHMHFRLARGVAAWVCLPWLNIIRPGKVVVGGNSFLLVEYYQLMVIECFLFSSHWLSFFTLIIPVVFIPNKLFLSSILVQIKF